MGARLALVIACALPTIAMAAPKPDPLRPPPDAHPKAPSAAKRASARAHYTRALKLYQQKKYQAAHGELELALKLAPDPDLHYALARVDIELDRCEDVISELEAFLETPHGQAATKAATDDIATCKAKLAPPPPPPAPPPPPPPKPVPPPPPSPSWYRDRLGDGLVITGTVSGIAALLCYRSAVSDLDAADAAMTLPDHAHRVDDAHHMRTYAFVLAGSGLAFVTAGVVRYVTHDRREKPRKDVAVVPIAGGGMIAISGSFP